MRARSSMPCLLLRSSFPVQALECSYPFCLLQYLFCHAMQVAVCARFGWPGLFCALVRENPRRPPTYIAAISSWQPWRASSGCSARANGSNKRQLSGKAPPH